MSLNNIMPFDVGGEFLFNSSSRDFLVEEIPLYQFSGEGEHLIIKVKKKDLTTWDMINIISSAVGVPKKEVGYAGLKDKNATTIQSISIPKKYQKALESFEHPKIKFLDTTFHQNKIRVGHLKGNRFWLRFKKVLPVSRDKIDSTIRWIAQNGSPNYFGYQRFGKDGDNYKDGKEIIDGKKRIRDRKLKEFLISSYQSFLFNSWLSQRVKLSRLLKDFSTDEVEKILKIPKNSLKGVDSQQNFFKVLEGDLMMHYPFGRIFTVDDTIKESQRFFEKDISPTGLIAGKKVTLAGGVASIFERNFLDDAIKERGSRRYAWIFPQEIKGRYIKEKAQYELEFTLPKGSYATVIVDFLQGGIKK
jgi:tRNA pseudouridine13 synthase